MIFAKCAVASLAVWFANLSRWKAKVNEYDWERREACVVFTERNLTVGLSSTENSQAEHHVDYPSSRYTRTKSSVGLL